MYPKMKWINIEYGSDELKMFLTNAAGGLKSKSRILFISEATWKPLNYLQM